MHQAQRDAIRDKAKEINEAQLGQQEFVGQGPEVHGHEKSFPRLQTPRLSDHRCCLEIAVRPMLHQVQKLMKKLLLSRCDLAMGQKYRVLYPQKNLVW